MILLIAWGMAAVIVYCALLPTVARIATLGADPDAAGWTFAALWFAVVAAMFWPVVLLACCVYRIAKAHGAA